MSKVSIIIPVFNTAEFLEECFESVINQTYKNLEIIVINDGSTDSSNDVINNYAKIDKRVKTYNIKNRSGVSRARNIGLENVTGDYVIFLDSDDWLDVEAIELLIQNIGDNQLIQGTTVRTSKSRQTVLDNINDDHNDNEAEDDDEIGVISAERNKIIPVHNLLIKTDFIKEHDLKFYEDVEHYVHYSFIVPIMALKIEIPRLFQKTYFKRRRNDPINNPSLSQSERYVRVSSYLHIYRHLKEVFERDNRANEVLDYNFINFYNRIITLVVRNREYLDYFYEELVETVRLLNIKAHDKASIIVKRELKLLQKGRKTSFYRLLKIHDLMRKVRHSLKSRRRWYIFLYRQLFMKMPLKKNRIVFESFLGKNYSCSPKYIYEHMLKENMDYEFIWIFNERNENIPGKPKQVKRFSLRYFYYLATAKYWVSNSRLPLFLNKREGNVYLQTWHGTPLKKLVFDMDDIHSANPRYKADFYKQSRRWDYLVSPNSYSSKIFRRAFMFEKEMIEVGYPRNDILYNDNRQTLITNLKEKLNIPVHKKVILYAPTWRDDEFYAPGKYKFQLQLDLEQMREQLGDDYVVILRMHYFIADHIDTEGFEDFVVNLSHYDDIAELYLISDILITDYSSVFFDYANLRRPILFYTYDLEKYRDTLRGFYINMEEDLPGPLLKTTSEIVSAIKNIDELNASYEKKYDEFYNTYCRWDDGNAARKIVDIVFNNKN